EAVDLAIAQGRATIDEICRTIRMMGGEASRSSVGRYRKSYAERLEKFREAQAIAGDWIRQMRADPDGDVGQLLAEQLKVLAFQTQAEMQEGEVERDPKHLAQLARMLRDVTSADKMRREIRDALRREIVAEAADRAESAGRKAGASPEALRRIREEIYGLVGGEPDAGGKPGREG
ncbi:MAG: DUF3486 family protein, partial [Acetobacteraceae bacterium]|nr:DUF3486 family protein [Acetobacteraceae bacterium]